MALKVLSHTSPSGVVYQSVAGSALSVLVHSLMLMPLETIKPLLPSFLALLPSIDRLNKVLPAAALLEEQELEWPVQGELCSTIAVAYLFIINSFKLLYLKLFSLICCLSIHIKAFLRRLILLHSLLLSQ